MKPKTVLLVAASSALVMLAFVAMTKGTPAPQAAATAAKKKHSATRATKSPTRTCTLAITDSQIVATYQMQGHNHAPGEACRYGH